MGVVWLITPRHKCQATLGYQYFFPYLTSSNSIFFFQILPEPSKMPRTYIAKGILQMDRTALEKAFNYCVESGCSIREAARKFDVKRTTLQVRGIV